ncbi:hypothetical protein KAR91_36920 [Candidatus Pacearchaeota archaeon]|nr:hypothetical protein [Candidatus Pacearchaeota archaeon]
MKNTVTAGLHKRMAAVDKDMVATLKELQSVGKEAGKKYDKIIPMRIALDKKLAKNPDDQDLLKSRIQLEEVSVGLKATVDYCNNLIEQQTGEQPKEPKRHGSRGHKGQFAKKGSIGHMMRGAGLLLKKVTGGK